LFVSLLLAGPVELDQAFEELLDCGLEELEELEVPFDEELEVPFDEELEEPVDDMGGGVTPLLDVPFVDVPFVIGCVAATVSSKVNRHRTLIFSVHVD